MSSTDVRQQPATETTSKNGGLVIAGRYQLDKTIGQGTYGKVKLATDNQTNEKVYSDLHVHVVYTKTTVIGCSEGSGEGQYQKSEASRENSKGNPLLEAAQPPSHSQDL